MALYTREDAKESAKIAKNYDEFTVVIGVAKGFKMIQRHNYTKRAQELWEGLEKLKETLDGRVIIITEKTIKEQFPYATTIKDLEVILYQLVNYKIQELQKRYVPSVEEVKEEVVYASDVGYNSRRMRFYVPVRETEKSIWLQQVGKKMIGGDPQNPLVIPDTSVKDGEVIRRVKRDGKDTIKIGNYEYARRWNGSPIQEFSD